MKKATLLFVALTLVLGLCACGDSNGSTKKTKDRVTDETTTTSVTTTTSASTTESTVTTTEPTSSATESTVTEQQTDVSTTTSAQNSVTTTLAPTTTASTTTTTKAVTTTTAGKVTTTTTTKKTTVTTASTICTHFENYDLNGRWYENTLTAVPVEVYWEGNGLAVKCRIVNGYSNRTAYNVCVNTLTVSDGKNIIATANFNNQNLTVDPLSYIEHTFHFAADTVLRPGADLEYILLTVEKGSMT